MGCRIDPRTISASVIAWLRYFDEILVLNPFTNGVSMRPEFSPIDSPTQYKEQTIKNVALTMALVAVSHYQFEAIHPFTDGNGRTGRILNLLMLVERGLLDEPILYLSRYIIENRPAYYRLLLDVTLSNAWEPWILYMLAAVLDTAKWTQARIAAIEWLIQVTAENVRSKVPKIYSRELVDVLFNQPYCRIENVVEAGIAKRETASRYLKALAAAELLREEKIGREKLFVNTGFLSLLVAEKAGG